MSYIWQVYGSALTVRAVREKRDAHRAAMFPLPSAAQSEKPLYFMNEFTRYEGFCYWAGGGEGQAEQLHRL